MLPLVPYTPIIWSRGRLISKNSSHFFMLKSQDNNNLSSSNELFLGSEEVVLPDLNFSVFKDYGIESPIEVRSMLLCFSLALPTTHGSGLIIGDD